MIHAELTDKIIECYYNVYNKLGYGFLESVYERAMIVELNEQGLSAKNQVPITVKYHKVNVGEFFADILVNGKVILELKATDKIAKEHEFQLINYLRATNIEVGLLLNFGRKPQFKRKVYTNQQKGSSQ